MFQFLYGRIIAVLNHVTTVSRFKMLRVINITNICYQNLTLVFTLYEKQDFTPGKEYSYIVDVDPSSFDEPHVVEAIDLSKTIFVNAVMGLMPHFWHGTYKMDEMIDCNRSAQKFFGGGDTLQEFKR
jgi:3-phosphoglycerate kinase